MAASVRLDELQPRVRELADMETAAAASHLIDDTELNRAINRNLKRLYDKLIMVRGDDYYATSSTISTVAAQAAYALPATFYQLLTVMAYDGSGNYRDLKRWGYKDLAALKSLEANSNSGLEWYRYRLVGTTVEIRPKPTAATDTLEYHFIPTMTELANASDTFDGVNGWEDWACYGAAVDMANKEESYEHAAALKAQQAELTEAIRKLAGSRDAGRPQQVQDTRKDWSTRRRFGRNDWNY